MEVDCFKKIFESLKLGTISETDSAIFKEVADFDGDGKITFEDFKQILNYKPGEMDQLDIVEEVK